MMWHTVSVGRVRSRAALLIGCAIMRSHYKEARPMDMSLDMLIKILKATYYTVLLATAVGRARKEYSRWRMTRRKK